MLVELFKALNEKYPPPENCKHAIFIQDVDTEVLGLTLWAKGSRYFIYFYESDIADTEEVLNDIEILLNDPRHLLNYIQKL